MGCHQEHKGCYLYLCKLCFTQQEFWKVPTSICMGPGFTRHTCIPAHIALLYNCLLGSNLLPTIMQVHTQLHLVSIVPCRVSSFSPLLFAIIPTHIPNTQTSHTPKLPYTPISVVQPLVSAHFYLCSLTFSHIAEEVASVWRQQKLVFNNLIYCFVSALKEISYY